jgi:hypothetical protein
MSQCKTTNVDDADVGEDSEEDEYDDRSHYDDCKRELALLLAPYTPFKRRGIIKITRGSPVMGGMASSGISSLPQIQRIFGK